MSPASPTDTLMGRSTEDSKPGEETCLVSNSTHSWISSLGSPGVPLSLVALRTQDDTSRTMSSTEAVTRIRAVPVSSLTEPGTARKEIGGFRKSPVMATGSAKMVIPSALPVNLKVSSGSATPSSLTSSWKETLRSVSPAGITTRMGGAAVKSVPSAAGTTPVRAATLSSEAVTTVSTARTADTGSGR